ncbi:protein stand still isoform X1 [Drosophila bipectinata]|uniref:protein stand still isoform X1 n=1 Tax=Drosophila bipectinata TaxID=42026 RepID=UPI001C8A3B0C|nr:protein stand still [Drosophila bipectinata]
MDGSPDGSEIGKVEINGGTEKRQHVPYILNGELYRIENQVGDNVTVKCCYCPPDRIYRGSVRSTGNFHMHIKRRHSSLLGKLHEMKVAALEERRDRIMKNRRFGKPRKKSPPCQSSGDSPSDIVEGNNAGGAPTGGVSEETRELKIKTVFQRHKQEQEGAAIRSSNDSTSDTSGKANTSSIYLLQNVETVTTTSPSTPHVGILGRVKPEKSNSSGLLGNQPEAIDLSRAQSHQNGEVATSSLSFTPGGTSLEYPRSQAVAQSLSFTHFVENSHRDVLQRLDRTMTEISQELRSRNRIEQNRLLLEAAKFKYLNPNFKFEPTL